jgi:hypothetical protein
MLYELSETHIHGYDSKAKIKTWTQESRTSTRHCRYSVHTKIRFTGTKTKRQQQ